MEMFQRDHEDWHRRLEDLVNKMARTLDGVERSQVSMQKDIAQLARTQASMQGDIAMIKTWVDPERQ